MKIIIACLIILSVSFFRLLSFEKSNDLSEIKYFVKMSIAKFNKDSTISINERALQCVCDSIAETRISLNYKPLYGCYNLNTDVELSRFISDISDIKCIEDSSLSKYLLLIEVISFGEEIDKFELSNELQVSKFEKIFQKYFGYLISDIFK